MVRLKDLQIPSVESIHFSLLNDHHIDFNSLGFSVMTGSVGNISSNSDLFSVVASAMEFPDYFGNNWDALNDCLRDMEWMPAAGYLLVLNDASKGWSHSPYVLGQFVSTWLGACEYWIKHNVPFHLLFVM